MSRGPAGPVRLTNLIHGFVDDTDGKGGPGHGIPTSIRGLDATLGGLRPGLLYLITGYPGVGTSTLALGFAREASIRHGRATLLLSPATPRLDVLHRVFAAESKVRLHCVQSGDMSEEEQSRLDACCERIDTAPLYVDDDPGVDINDLPPSAPDTAATPWGMIVIDGAALLTRSTAPEHLWAAHTKLAQDTKRLAQRIRVPVVLTVSASRQITRRAAVGVPQLGDVAVSAAYEAEADVVIGVSRPDLLDRESRRWGEADLVLLKTRYSVNARIIVAFQGHYARFVDMAL